MIKRIIDGDLSPLGKDTLTMRLTTGRMRDLIGKGGRNVKAVSDRNDVYVETDKGTVRIGCSAEAVRQARGLWIL